MQSEAYIRAGFGEAEFHNATTLHPVGVAALAVGVIATLACRRTHALLPLLCICTLLPSAQRVVVLGLDFSFPRLLLLALAARATLRGEWRLGRPTRIDRAFLAWVACAGVAYVVRKGSSSALIYKLGGSYDLLGLYWLGRNYMRSSADVRNALRALALISLVSAVLFSIEKTTGRNFFSVFGGPPEITNMREGRLRCQGPFAHPILAGVLWAGLVPMFVGSRALVQSTSERLLFTIAPVACMVIVVACSSSTPLLGVLAAAGFLAMWPLRTRVPAIRGATLAGLTVIHFVRAKPVWHLIALAGVVGGSTGYHRYQLIDAFIRRWTEWFLVGTSSTAHWGHFLFDLANQFVKEGVEGGILTFVTFCLFLFRAFALVGRLLRSKALRPSQRFVTWGLGSSLAALCVMFIGISISHSPPNLLTFLLPAICLEALSLDARRARRRAVSAGAKAGSAMDAPAPNETAAITVGRS